MSPLWPSAREVIRTLFHAIGEPQVIASQLYVNRKVYNLFLTWLRAGETLLRRMLLLDARAATVPLALARRSLSESGSSRQAATAGKMPAVRKRRAAEFMPDQPDDWRVSFRCAVPMERGRPRPPAPANAGETPAVHIFSTRPLALRAEALLRVCNNPAPYIARLARLIARAPRLIARIAAVPHQRKRKSGDPPYYRDIVGHDLWAKTEPDTS